MFGTNPASRDIPQADRLSRVWSSILRVVGDSSHRAGKGVCDRELFRLACDNARDSVGDSLRNAKPRERRLRHEVGVLLSLRLPAE